MLLRFPSSSAALLHNPSSEESRPSSPTQRGLRPPYLFTIQIRVAVRSLSCDGSRVVQRSDIVVLYINHRSNQPWLFITHSSGVPPTIKLNQPTAASIVRVIRLQNGQQFMLISSLIRISDPLCVLKGDRDKSKASLHFDVRHGAPRKICARASCHGTHTHPLAHRDTVSKQRIWC